MLGVGCKCSLGKVSLSLGSQVFMSRCLISSYAGEPDKPNGTLISAVGVVLGQVPALNF